MSRRLLLAALLLVCTPARAEDPPGAPLGAPPAPPPFTEEAAFLGFSDVRPVVLGSNKLVLLEGLGTAWAQPMSFAWGTVQPQAPIAGRVLSDWSHLDHNVHYLQRLGFAPLITLSPSSPWASQEVATSDWAQFVRARLPAADAELALRGAKGVTPPRAEHWKAWQAFVRAFVERYDGDGLDDMGGLLRPLRQVQILDRIQDGDHWLGSAEDYLRLLHHASEGAGEAHPTFEIVHAAVDLRGLFRPDDEQPDRWRDRLAENVPEIPALLRLETQRGVEAILRSLETPGVYRALPLAGSGNHVEDALNLRALRALLDARGSTNVPVWLTDSPVRRIAPPRVPLAGGRTPAQQQALLSRLRALDSERSSGFPGGPIETWLEAATAADFVRGAALARAAGASRILVGGDSSRAREGGDAGRALRGEQSHHLLRGIRLREAPRRSAGYLAVRQMNALLLGHRGAAHAPLGASGTAIVFSFGERAPLPWVAVLLLDDGGVWGGEPGKPLPTTRVQVPLPPGDVDIEELALVDGPPKRRRVRVVEGLLAVDLTSAPLYVLPAR